MRLLVATAALTLLLTGCGDDEPEVADDPGVVVDDGDISVTPTASPTVGSYPDFGPEDYVFTLSTSCFCLDAGVPIRVTVAGDRVTEAVYAADSQGRGSAKKGDPAPDYLRKTIDDVIDAANNTEAASVTVDWPAGQDYPSSVRVDENLNMMDEEVGYTISDVQIS